MKGFYVDNYSKITMAFWAVFIIMLWLQYIYLSTLVQASLFLIVLIPAVILSYLLANRYLPRAIHKKKMRFFALQFFAISFFIAFLLGVSYQLIRWAESEGYFSQSILLADKNSLMADVFFGLPSVLLINCGSCGLRFFYENIKLQKVHLEAQLQMLQSQINPHFMFNVLNHIHILMQTNVELASDLLLQYSDMLRFQLYKGKCDTVRLEEEILFLKNFIEIEKMRWRDKLQVECIWNITDKNRKIPPLLMLPFIENAFKYASRTIKKQGFVKIVLQQENAGFFLEVLNSKSIISPSKNTDASGIGLSNTRQRLQLLFGENYHLTIKDDENTYYLKLEICQL